MYEKILKNVEKIKKIDKETDTFYRNTSNLVNCLLLNFKLKLQFKFDIDIFNMMDDTFNFAVKYNLLDDEKKQNFQMFIVNTKCDIFEEEEGVLNADINQQRSSNIITKQ